MVNLSYTFEVKFSHDLSQILTFCLQILNQGLGSKAIEIINSLLASRGILLAELQKISEAIGQTIDELQDADLNLGRFELINSSLKPRLPGSSAGSSNKKMGVGQLAGILQNILEVLFSCFCYTYNLTLHSGGAISFLHLYNLCQVILLLTSVQKSDGMVDFGNDVMLYTLSKEELLDLFLTVGNQLSFIWNAFLNFHRCGKLFLTLLVSLLLIFE